MEGRIIMHPCSVSQFQSKLFLVVVARCFPGYYIAHAFGFYQWTYVYLFKGGRVTLGPCTLYVFKFALRRMLQTTCFGYPGPSFVGAFVGSAADTLRFGA